MSTLIVEPMNSRAASALGTDRYMIPFVNSCIRSMAHRYALTVKAAYLYLKKFMGLGYLIEFYDTIHLQSIDDAVDEMIVVCRKNGGQLL